MSPALWNSSDPGETAGSCRQSTVQRFADMIREAQLVTTTEIARIGAPGLRRFETQHDAALEVERFQDNLAEAISDQKKEK